MKSDSTTVIKNMEFLVKELHKEWDRSGASKASVIISLEEVDGIGKCKRLEKELNLVSWNGAAPKYDLRDWAPEHEKMGKGITLSADEVQELYKLLSKIVED